MAVSLQTMAQASVIAEAINTLSGVTPTIKYYPDHAELTFSAKDAKNIRQQLKARLKAAPGSVRIDTRPIITPLALEMLAPYAIAALAGAFLIGRALK